MTSHNDNFKLDSQFAIEHTPVAEDVVILDEI